MLARFSGKIAVCRVHRPAVVGGGDLAVDERLADAAAAVAVADVDRRLGDAGVDGSAWRSAWAAAQPTTWPSSSATQRWSGSQAWSRARRSGTVGLEGGVAGGDALGVDPSHRRPVARSSARTVTSAGRSSGQHGRGPSMPMTASAACGSPVQQAALTETRVAVLSLRSTTNPTSASLRTWCEHVDWLMPELLGQLAHGHRTPGDRDGVQQPHPGRVGQAGEPLRVGRGVVRRQLPGRGRAAARCRGRSTLMRTVSTHIDGCVNRRRVDTVAERSIEASIDGGAMTIETDLPVVVIGAGPSGLAAAAHLLERGLEPLVLEAGPSAGTACAQWHHVRLFSRWGELVDPAAEKLLAPTGWIVAGPGPVPDRGGVGERRTCSRSPTHWVSGSATARGSSGSPAAAVTVVVDAGRDTEPLTVHVDDRGRGGADHRARGGRRLGHVDDAEPARRGRFAGAGRGGGGRPDHLPGARPDRSRRAGPVRGASGSRSPAAGHSALTALVAFAELAEQEPGTRVEWLLRRGQVGNSVRRRRRRPAARARRTGQRAAGAVAAGHITDGDRVPHRRGRPSTPSGSGGAGGRSTASLDPVDEVVAVTGFRPDLSLLSEVRLDLDPVLQAPRGAGPADRPERALVRHGLPARRRRAGPARAGGVPGRDEELRPRPDVPRADRLRAGPLRRRGDRRGPRGRRAGRAGAARDRGVRRRGPVRHRRNGRGRRRVLRQQAANRSPWRSAATSR